MASPNRRSAVGHRGWLALASVVLLADQTRAADIPVVGRKLTVLDKLTAANTAKMVFVSERDGVVTKGAGTDPTQIESRLDLIYGAANGAFDMPQGPNWIANGSTIAKYVNRPAPVGGSVKVGVIKPGEFVKVAAKSLGDTTLAILQPQNGVVSVAHTVTNGAETTRHCTQFIRCAHTPVAGGTGAKLICRGNSIGDPLCTAASPPSAVVGISAGGQHTCAVFDTGALRCWGGRVNVCEIESPGVEHCWRGVAPLGYGTADGFDVSMLPTAAGFVPVGGKVVQVATGRSHTCALLDDGAVRCWGFGFRGRLGYGNTDNIGEFDAAGVAGDVDVGGMVVQLAAGDAHTCALLDTGSVRCWGDGSLGRLGYGNTNHIGDDETPASAGDVNVGGTVVQIAAGIGTCALLDTGAVRCWGYGVLGSLGYGNTNDIGDDETPASAGDVDVGGTVAQVAVGQSHTCALLDAGTVRCWGSGLRGRLGYGNTSSIGDDETPASAGDVPIGGTVTRLTAGAIHTCALLDTGAVRCWGPGTGGQLGYGNTNDIGDDETAASAGDVNIGGTVVDLATGPGFFNQGDHTCALLDTGAVRCWGYGEQAQLGYGNTNDIGDDETPASAGDVPVL